MNTSRNKNQQSLQTHQCCFQANISHSNATVKFSCKMLVAWKNLGNRTFARTQNENVPIIDGVATFNESLLVQTYMLFDRQTHKYVKKETALCLLLISARKPNEQKLVGRVVVDLADVLNNHHFNEMNSHILSFCSIKDSSLTFNIICLSKVRKQLKAIQLDMDDFSVISQVADRSNSENMDDIYNLAKNQLNVIENQKEEVQQQVIQSQNQNIQEEKAQQKKVQFSSQQVNNQQQISHQSKEVFENIQQQIIQNQQNYQEIRNQVQSKQPINEFLQNQYNQIIKKQVQLENDKKINAEQLQKPIPEEDDQQQLLNTKKQIQNLNSENDENQQLDKVQSLTKLNQRDLQNQQQNSSSKMQQENFKLIQVISKMNITLSQERSRNQKLLQDLNLYSVQKTQYQNTINQINKRFHELQWAKNKQIKQLQSQLLKFKQKINKVKNQFEESQNIRLDIESELLQTKFELSQLKSERIVLEQQLNKKIQQMQKHSSIQIVSSSKLNLQNNQTSAQQQQLNYLRQKNKELMLQFQQLDFKKEEKQILSFELELRAAQQQLLRYETKRSEMQHQIIELQKQNYLLNNRLKQIEKSLQIAQEQKIRLQNKLSKFEEQFNISKAFIQKIQKQNVLICQENQIYKQKIQHFQERLLNENINNSGDKILISTLQKDLQKIQSLQKQTQNLIQLQKRNVQNLQNQIKNQKQMNISQKKFITKLNQNIFQLSQQNQNLRVQISKNQHQLLDTIQKYEHQLEAKRTQINNLQNKGKDEQSKNKQLHEKISKFSQKEQKMRESIQILQQESKRIYQIVVQKQQTQQLQAQQIQKLKQQISYISKELQESKRQLFELKNNKLNYQSEHSEERDSIDIRNSKMKQFQYPTDEKFDELQRQLVSRDSKIRKDYQQKLTFLQKQNNDLKYHLNSMQYELRNIKNQNQQLLFRLQTLQINNTSQNQSKLHEIIGQYEKSMKQLTSTNQSQQKIMKGLQQQVIDLEAKIIQIQHNSSEPKNTNNSSNQKIIQLTKYQQVLESQLESQSKQIQRLKQQAMRSSKQINSLKNQVQQSQVQKLNSELSKQFQTVYHREQVGYSNLNSHFNKQQISKGALQEISKYLQQIIKQRSQRDKFESLLQMAIGKNAIMEEEFFKTNKDKGVIVQKARTISMEFQKVKSKIFRWKGSLQDKDEIVSFLKPCESKITQIVEISQRIFQSQLSENID